MKLTASGRERLTFTQTAPAGFDGDDDGTPLSVQLTTLTGAGAIVASDYTSESGTYLGATDSDTAKDTILGPGANIEAYGARNYTGKVSVLREYDADGSVDADKDVLFAAIGERDVQGYWWQRVGKRGTAPWAAGDVGIVYHATTDVPKQPEDRNGFLKSDIKLSILKARNFVLAA